MTLASLAAKKPAAPHKTCRTCWVLGQLDPAYAEVFDAALRNCSARYCEIAAALLDERSIHLPANTISRHARGLCERGEKYRSGK